MRKARNIIFISNQYFTVTFPLIEYPTSFVFYFMYIYSLDFKTNFSTLNTFFFRIYKKYSNFVDG